VCGQKRQLSTCNVTLCQCFESPQRAELLALDVMLLHRTD
jgi:hypothetical protein